MPSSRSIAARISSASGRREPWPALEQPVLLGSDEHLLADHGHRLVTPTHIICVGSPAVSMSAAIRSAGSCIIPAARPALTPFTTPHDCISPLIPARYRALIFGLVSPHMRGTGSSWEPCGRRGRPGTPATISCRQEGSLAVRVRASLPRDNVDAPEDAGPAVGIGGPPPLLAVGRREPHPNYPKAGLCRPAPLPVQAEKGTKMRRKPSGHRPARREVLLRACLANSTPAARSDRAGANRREERRCRHTISMSPTSAACRAVRS